MINEEIVSQEISIVNNVVECLGYTVEENGAGYYLENNQPQLFFIEGNDIVVPFQRGLEWLRDELSSNPIIDALATDIQTVFAKYHIQEKSVA